MKFRDDDEMLAWDRFAAAALVATQAKWDGHADRAAAKGGMAMIAPKTDDDLGEVSAKIADVMLEKRRKRIG